MKTGKIKAELFGVGILLLAGIACADEVWVTVPQLTNQGALREIAALPRSDLQNLEIHSSYEVLKANPFSTQDLEKLTALHGRALQHLGDGKLEMVFEELGRLIDASKNVPNLQGIEKLRLGALVQRAALADSLKLAGSQALWANALAFAPTAQLDRELFSPPVIKKWNQLKPHIKMIPVFLVVPEASLLYIDGHQYKKPEKRMSLALGAGDHQVAILVPGALWSLHEIKVSEKSENQTFRMDVGPMVGGTCDAPHFRGHLPPHTKILASFGAGSCERVFDGSVWYSLAGRPLEMNTQAAPVALDFSGAAAPEKRTWMQKAVRSPWFWAAVGAVVTGTVIAIKQSQETQTTVIPTHGFN